MTRNLGACFSPLAQLITEMLHFRPNYYHCCQDGNTLEQSPDHVQFRLASCHSSLAYEYLITAYLNSRVRINVAVASSYASSSVLKASFKGTLHFVHERSTASRKRFVPYKAKHYMLS